MPSIFPKRYIHFKSLFFWSLGNSTKQLNNSKQTVTSILIQSQVNLFIKVTYVITAIRNTGWCRLNWTYETKFNSGCIYSAHKIHSRLTPSRRRLVCWARVCRWGIAPLFGGRCDTNGRFSHWKNSRNLLNGLERHRLERWLELLPEKIIWQRPRLLVTKAWLLYRHCWLKALVAVIDQLQHSLEEEGRIAGGEIVVNAEVNPVAE